MVKSITIVFEEKDLERMDSERSKKGFSRNKLIRYLLRKWFKDKCVIIMED